ncbi:hypothetical protein CEP54_004445 [Fusarium duplospermum]|uniref:Uncharacterized protein n=1 Tax=Fusarium duplospermum TaxID=1325734 RepID=A0A428QIK3_9HYPO|nr:hypothetical protein CEP54_004445 [Fusarium duplospermum]
MPRIRILARFARAVAVRVVLRPLARPVAAMIILPLLVLTIDMKEITVEQVIQPPCPLRMEDIFRIDGGINQPGHLYKLLERLVMVDTPSSTPDRYQFSRPSRKQAGVSRMAQSWHKDLAHPAESTERG